MFNITKILTENTMLKYLHDLKNYSSELYNHSTNVALYACLIGNKYNLGTAETTELAIAALLHDYGKLFISKEIINKPGALTLDERYVIQQHSILGYNYLKENTDLSQSILIGILDHHERIDGEGYGNNKKGNEISLYGKIIAIADVYDAMTSDRIYRKGMDKDYVISYILENSDTQFDSDMLVHFVNSGLSGPHMEHYSFNINRNINQNALC